MQFILRESTHNLRILQVTTMTKISNLSDYPAIKKLASALHQFDANQHGAAIMIGAGFSRSAACHVDGEKKLPLWNDFSKRLVEALNPNGKDLSFSDPLRVAEEFRSYFGQASLNDRIRFEIDDDAWRPGNLYKSLLELPWSEIMTTNWDTLLERAAKDVHSPFYTPVTKPSDLTWAASPRIVKLHGTIGVTDIFIAAQEDYRTYPEKYAPFVNFVRQVFIESELCLLGFSGDDPNFLQWTGWVRDHLANHTRKIYLVGALNLSVAQRKYLESSCIAPIDLWDAVKQHQDDRDLMHQTATELFLQAMSEEAKSKVKPYEWTPSNLDRPQVTQQDHIRQLKEPEYAAVLLKGQLETLRKDRESYPGWLVCPPLLQWQVRTQLSNPFPDPNNIAALEPDDRAKMLYEVSWRHNITFEYITPWLTEALLQIANPDQPCALSKHQQMEIALVLLKNSRWLDSSTETNRQATEKHIQILNGILEKYAPYLPDCAAELAYHQALVARDMLDYPGIESVVEKITGEDPVWKLRQAAMLMELGRSDEATQLIAKSYGQLQDSHRRDRYSIRILSRLVWAHWLLTAARTFDQTSEKLPSFVESKFRKWKCDPWVWIEDIQEKVNKQHEDYIKSHNPIEPLFDQGHYRNSSNNHSFNNKTPEFFLLQGLSRSVGIPLRSGSIGISVNLLANTAERLVLSGGIGVALWDYTLAIRVANSENSSSIKGIFTRIGLACAPKDVIDTLIGRIISAINYWSNLRVKSTNEQQSHALSVLRVLMEILARLVIRASSEKASEIFRLTISLGQQRSFQHIWLCDVIGHLMTHSLNSVPESKQGELLADAMAFPLQSEVMVGDLYNWPNPVINYPNERKTYPGIGKRIGELIAAITPSGSTSSSASLLRLLPLVQKENFFTSTERENLTVAIWGNTPDYQRLPSAVNLFPHAFLLLPVPDEEQVKALVQRHLYEHGEDVLTDTQKELRSFPAPEIQRAVMIYKGIANAAVNEATRLFPSSEQALTLFERLMKWRPWISSDSFFDIEDNSQPLIDSIGNALSYAIVPALSVEKKTVELFQQLQLFYNEVDRSMAILPAFVSFVSLNDEIACAVEKLIRKALQGRDAREVSYAAIALQKWSELSAPTSSSQFNSLVSRLIVIIESGRTVALQQLLWVVGELFEKKLLSNDQVATLKEAVTDAYNAADYVNIEPNSREAISASSIREACVKLAKKFYVQFPEDSILEDMINKSCIDALPEVRFAIES